MGDATMTATAPTRPEAADPWAGPSRFRAAREWTVSGFLLLCASITVVTTAGIVLVLGVEAVRFFQNSGIGLVPFLTGREIDFSADPPVFGLLPLAWGTFVIAAGSSVIALPIGLLSALYLSEYAPRRLRAVLKPSLELLAGIPTIVYGYLALVLVTPLLQRIFEPTIGVDPYNALSGCIVVGIMIVPMVSSLSDGSSRPRTVATRSP